MQTSERVKPDIAEDVLRIHRLITRALRVSVEQSAVLAGDSHPDAADSQGLIAYVRCLATLLHAHHVTEDDSVFPYLRALLPDVPYEALTAQHHAMDPVLDQIRAVLKDLADSVHGGESWKHLHEALDQMNALWHTHIAQEEQYVSADRLAALVDDDEQARMSRVFARAGRKHQMGVVPLYWLLPFLLYNVEGPDRLWMEQQVPGIVTRLLLPRIWKKRWAPMAPFLLEP